MGSGGGGSGSRSGAAGAAVAMRYEGGATIAAILIETVVGTAGVLVPLLRLGGAPGAWFGWDGSLHPMLASLAMALSSVSVVSSSLRLRTFRAE